MLRSHVIRLLLVLLCWGALVLEGQARDNPAPQKFNEVREVAPGVFFRYSSIGPDESKIPFGGCNNIWVVFEDFVVVIDANFPKEAADVVEAVRKTTSKPIRYVFDTHHHGDHAYGNAVFAKEGASIVAQANCARLLRVNGPKEFADAGRPPTGRKDIAQSSLKVPSVIFDDKLVLDDGVQRVEFLFFGHGHTPGDASAYLPKHKILCTGDACVNGPYNFMGHADSASWIRALDRMQQLDIAMICPGHGPVAGKDLLEKQKRYFVELRKQVQQGIDAGKESTEILQSLDMPWYREWTTVAANSRKENVDHVYKELTGRIKPGGLVQGLKATEIPATARASAGWKKPERVIVPNLMPDKLAELRLLAPELEFVRARSTEEALGLVENADAVLGFYSVDILRQGKKLRWIQPGPTWNDRDIATAVGSKPVITHAQRIEGADRTEQQWSLWRENVRRFAAGEPLLDVAP